MKSIILLAAASLIITACEDKKESESYTRERDSLISIINQRDASLNEFLAVNSEIEKNLDEIAVREGAISKSMMKEIELKPEMQDRINADIAAINELTKNNRAKIDEFNRKLKESKSENSESAKMIDHLNSQIAKKDNDLMYLNDKFSALKMRVAKLETSVNVLATRNNAQSKTIQEQTNALHAAFYVVGESKELQDKNIINKTGGLLGIGRSSQLDPNIDNSNFKRIDYMQIKSIEINSKDAKLITYHPDGSYSFEKDANKKIINLQINDPDKFWSASKYLVVVKD